MNSFFCANKVKYNLQEFKKMAKKELSLDEILKKLDAAEKEFDEKMKNSGLDKIIAEDIAKKTDLK